MSLTDEDLVKIGGIVHTVIKDEAENGSICQAIDSKLDSRFDSFRKELDIKFEAIDKRFDQVEANALAYKTELSEEINFLARITGKALNYHDKRLNRVELLTDMHHDALGFDYDPRYPLEIPDDYRAVAKSDP